MRIVPDRGGVVVVFGTNAGMAGFPFWGDRASFREFLAVNVANGLFDTLDLILLWAIKTIIQFSTPRAKWIEETHRRSTFHSSSLDLQFVRSLVDLALQRQNVGIRHRRK